MSAGSTGDVRGRVLLSGALASLAAFIALTAVVTQQGFDAIDGLARALVHRPDYALLQSSMETASFLGGHPGQIVVIVLGFAFLWRQRRRRWSCALPLVMAGAGILQMTAKWAIDRPRPNLDPWGFPSAHVLTVVVLTGYMAYVIATSSRRQSLRALAVASCAAIVGVVAFSRMYLDAHWLSDVLGGASVGVAYLLTSIWLIESAPTLAPQNRTATPMATNGPASTSILLSRRSE
jgi:membrane-associated phospholipid phosphatase